MIMPADTSQWNADREWKEEEFWQERQEEFRELGHGVIICDKPVPEMTLPEAIAAIGYLHTMIQTQREHGPQED